MLSYHPLTLQLHKQTEAARTFLVLDLGLDGVDGVACLDLEGDGFAGEGLDENLQKANICYRSADRTLGKSQGHSALYLRIECEEYGNTVGNTGPHENAQTEVTGVNGG